MLAVGLAVLRVPVLSVYLCCLPPLSFHSSAMPILFFNPLQTLAALREAQAAGDADRRALVQRKLAAQEDARQLRDREAAVLKAYEGTRTRLKEQLQGHKVSQAAVLHHDSPPHSSQRVFLSC